MADPRGVGTVAVELNSTVAELLARLAVETELMDPSALVARALGLMEMCMRQKRGGGRLCFINERGETSDVVF